MTMTALNAREVEMAFAGFASDVSDLRPAWPVVSAALQQMVMGQQFGSEGSRGQHGKWAELSPAYAERKLKRFGPVPILQATGRLLASFSEGGADHIDRQAELNFEWGSSVPYAVYHQTGYAKSFGGGRARATVGAETRRAYGLSGHPRGWARKGFARGTPITARNVPARREIDPTQENIDQIRRAIQMAIVQMIRRRGFAIASGIYGPSEMGGITGGEAFQIGKTGGGA
jgi:phage gpG-like protein